MEQALLVGIGVLLWLNQYEQCKVLIWAVVFVSLLLGIGWAPQLVNAVWLMFFDGLVTFQLEKALVGVCWGLPGW